MSTEKPATDWQPPKAPRSWSAADRTGQRGTKEQLLRAGVPEAWLRDLPAPGRKRGARTVVEAGREVHVSVGERGVYYVQTTTLADVVRIEQQRGPDFARFLQRAIGQ